VAKTINRRKKSTSKAIDDLAGLAKTQAIAYLTIQFPLLTWGPIGWLIGELIFKFQKFMLKKTVIGTNLIIISADIGADVSGVNKSLKSADIVATNKKSTKEDIDEANEDIKDAMRDLVRVGRSRF